MAVLLAGLIGMSCAACDSPASPSGPVDSPSPADSSQPPPIETHGSASPTADLLPATVCADSLEGSLMWEPIDPEPRQFLYVVLTNRGSAACELAGIPGMEFLGPEGPVTTAFFTADAFDRATTPVVLAPGDSAYVWTYFPGPALLGRACDADSTRSTLTPAGLVVQAPGATKPITIENALDVCLIGPSPEIQVGPIDSEPRSSSLGI